MDINCDLKIEIEFIQLEISELEKKIFGGKTGKLEIIANSKKNYEKNLEIWKKMCKFWKKFGQAKAE